MINGTKTLTQRQMSQFELEPLHAWLASNFRLNFYSEEKIVSLKIHDAEIN